MKQYKGVVFFDYDGTLIDEVDGIFELPDSAKEALTTLRENGYATCICSGRTKRFSEKVKDYFDGYVTGQGAYVEMDGEVVFSSEIPVEEIEELRLFANPRNTAILIESANQSYCDLMDSEEYEFFRYVFAVDDGWVVPWETGQQAAINKLVLMYRDPEDTQVYIDLLKDRYELGKHIRYLYLDITPKGVDKGTGIRKVMEYLGLPMEKSYGFCDGDNDMPIVKTVHKSVLLGRHFEGLKPFAYYVTDTVKNDGLKKGLEYLGLI